MNYFITLNDHPFAGGALTQELMTPCKNHELAKLNLDALLEKVLEGAGGIEALDELASLVLSITGAAGLDTSILAKDGDDSFVVFEISVRGDVEPTIAVIKVSSNLYDEYRSTMDENRESFAKPSALH